MEDMVVGSIKVLQKFSPQILDEVTPPVEVKSVTINLSKGHRDFKFSGNWTGNDVRIVQTGFFREYRLYQREMRRNGVKQTGGRNG